MKNTKLIFFLFFIFNAISQIVLASSLEKNLIFLYEDEGASPEAIKNTRYSLAAVIDPRYEIKSIRAEDILQGIDDHCALLILPGGRATPYREKLFEKCNGAGNKNIKRFIEEGGCYLGLGAGAYYAGSQVLFDQDNQNPNQRINVSEEKLLAFFPGPIIGPVFKPFVYQSHEGAIATKILFSPLSEVKSYSTESNQAILYYNGGGYFDPIACHGPIKIIAYYDLPIQLPAIIECPVGKGKAILSSVHPEYTFEILDQTSPDNLFLQKLKPSLSDKDSLRVLKTLIQMIPLALK